jgi:hypothetical protein
MPAPDRPASAIPATASPLTASPVTASTGPATTGPTSTGSVSPTMASTDPAGTVTASTGPASPGRVRATRRQGGPPPLVPALVYGALLVATVALLAGAPHHGSPAASTLSWSRAHTGTLHAAALLIFGATAPLAIWTATIYRRLRTLGVTAPGAVIGLSGGLLASASLALSGLVTWTLAGAAPVASPALAKVLTDLAFASGAAGFVVPLALLLAGVAVPSLILRLIPAPLAWAGLAVAAVGVLSTFTLVTPALDATLPIARFGGLAWIIAASLLLPANRHQIRPSAQPRPTA